MSMEKAKSIVLTLLVTLSLILTWGLWAYQPQYDFIQSASYIKSVSIGEKREYLDVIKPIQFIYHDKGKHFGITDRKLKNELYKVTMALNTTDIEEVQDFPGDQLDSLIDNTTSLEMIFPTALPIGVLSYLLAPVSEELSLQYFDRLIVNFSGTPELYFVSTRDKQFVQVTIEDGYIGSLKEKVVANYKQFPTYFSLHAGNGSIIYLPEEQMALSQLTYSSQNISTVELKNALFSDPNKVKQYSIKNGEESYTDGLRALEVSQTQNTMSFINPANQEVFDMKAEDMLIKSIDFINDHSGWTDSFSLMGLNSKQQTLVFNMKIEGYPIFDPARTMSIFQSWRANEIYEYQRTLTNLRFSIDSEKQQVFIPSGRELLSGLTENKHDFKLELLENALVGFEVIREGQSSTVIKAQPKWFIKYAGNWEAVDLPTTIINQGGNSSGLE